MKIGTKSVLVGAHQFIIHPTTVFLAWCKLYGWPNWKEFLCILGHDLGYIGCQNMEGEEGVKHPEKMATWAYDHLDDHSLSSGDEPADWNCQEAFRYFHLCLLHSRTLAAEYHQPPSKLCWADKLSVRYDPWFIYLPRVILSGEIHEYRKEADTAGLFPLSKSNREWHEWARERMIRKAYSHDERPPSSP
jgi:hypothetical protein